MAANAFSGAYKKAGGQAGSGLNPDDFNYFQTAQRRVGQTWALGQQQNDFGVRSADLQNTEALNNLRYKYAQLQRGVATPYARGGLLNSGLYQKGWDDWQAQKNLAYGSQQQNYQNQLAGLSLAKGQLSSEKYNGYTDVAAQKAARRAAAAAISSASVLG